MIRRLFYDALCVVSMLAVGLMLAAVAVTYATT